MFSYHDLPVNTVLTGDNAGLCAILNDLIWDTRCLQFNRVESSSAASSEREKNESTAAHAVTNPNGSEAQEIQGHLHDSMLGLATTTRFYWVSHRAGQLIVGS